MKTEELRAKMEEMVKYLLDNEVAEDQEIVDSYTDTFVMIAEDYANKNHGISHHVSDCHNSWWWKLKNTIIGKICIKCRYSCR